MNQDTPGCGTTQTMGHGEGATCGQSFYGSPWYCSACTQNAAIAAAVAAERERCAKLCESMPPHRWVDGSDQWGNPCPAKVVTTRAEIAAAIRGN